MLSYLALALLLLAIFGYYLGYAKARAFLHAEGGVSMHSLSGYHGSFVALWAAIPSVLLVLFWLLFQGSVINNLIMSSLPAAMTQGLDKGQYDLLLSEIISVSKGNLFGTPRPEIVAAAERYNSWNAIAELAMVASALFLAVVGLSYARGKLAPRFRARNGVENILTVMMIVCSLIAILTTLGIVVSLAYETFRFFTMVPISDFFIGLNWEPQIAIRPDQITAGGAFGAIPVFVGTLLIALIAMAVATPAILPVPIVADSAVIRALNGLMSPSPTRISAKVPSASYISTPHSVGSGLAAAAAVESSAHGSCCRVTAHRRGPAGCTM
jgi:phosphate transport system permease protein